MRNLKHLLKTLCREQTIGFVLDINYRQKKLEKLILSKYFLLPSEGTRLPGHVGSEGNQKTDELVRKEQPLHWLGMNLSVAGETCSSKAKSLRR